MTKGYVYLQLKTNWADINKTDTYNQPIQFERTNFFFGDSSKLLDTCVRFRKIWVQAITVLPPPTSLCKRRAYSYSSSKGRTETEGEPREIRHAANVTVKKNQGKMQLYVNFAIRKIFLQNPVFFNQSSCSLCSYKIVYSTDVMYVYVMGFDDKLLCRVSKYNVPVVSHISIIHYAGDITKFFFVPILACFNILHFVH